MSDFACVINFRFNGEDAQSMVLDTIDDVDVSGRATVTTQPMVNGDEVSDHMFKHAKTMTISGIFSMAGSKGILVDKNEIKLADFEKLFERIQNEAVLCNIYKVSVKNEKDIRFVQRNNMVLESFSWREKINSVGFTLNFRQVLMSNIVEFDVDTDDEFLPNVSEPATLSFTNTLIDWNKIDASICDILEKESLWTTEFKNYINSLGDAALAALLPAAAAAVLIAVMVALNTNPIGWVITAAALVVTAVVLFFKTLINGINEAKRRRKYAIKTFEYYKNNDKKNAQELERFADFISEIHKEFNSIDSLLHIYQVSENVPQEAMVSVGDDYYVFTFTKNNINNKYSLNISNVDNSITKDFADIEASPESFDQVTSSNYLVKAKNNARIYLLNPADNKKDLTNYFIVVCDFNPDDFNKMITDIIGKHIYRDAQNA